VETPADRPTRHAHNRNPGRSRSTMRHQKAGRWIEAKRISTTSHGDVHASMATPLFIALLD
jgi:hypothetical protein